MIQRNGVQGAGAEKPNYWIYAGALAAILVIETFYRDPLFKWSMPFEEQVQAKTHLKFLKFFEFFSFLGAGVIYAVIFLWVLNTQTRARGFYYIMFFTFCFYMTNLGKLFYHNPRPYMADDNLNVYQCSMEYGNPSGHSIMAGGFAFFCFLDVFYSEVVTLRPKWHKWAGLAAAIFWTLTVGFARIYQADHSADQVLFGWSLGIWLAFFFHFCLRSHILSHISQVVSNPGYVFSYAHLAEKATIAAVVLFMSQVLVYWHAKNTFSPPQEWIDNLNRKCGNPAPNKTFNYTSVSESGVVLLSFANYIGIIYQRCKWGVIPDDYLKGTGVENFVKRLVVLVVLCLPAVVPLLMVDITAALWKVTIFKLTVPCLWAGFVMFGLTYPVWKHYGMIRIQPASNE